MPNSSNEISDLFSNLAKTSQYNNRIEDLFVILQNFDLSLDQMSAELRDLPRLGTKTEQLTEKIAEFNGLLEDKASLLHFHEEKADLDHSHGDYSLTTHLHPKEYSKLKHSHPENAPLSHDHPLLSKELSRLEKLSGELESRFFELLTNIRKKMAEPHARSHLLGPDALPLATEKTRGFMSPRHVRRLEALERAKGAKTFAGGGGSGGTGTATAFVLPFVNADLDSGVLTVTHNLGKQFVNITAYDENNKVILPDEITVTSTSALTVDFSSAGSIDGTIVVI